MEPVLIITYYWPPSGGSGVQRPLKFSKYLPSFGYKPIVFTSANPTFAQIDESLLSEIPEETEVFTRKGFEPYSIYGKLKGTSAKQAANQTSSFKDGGGFVSKFAAWIRGNLFIPDARVFWSLSARNEALKLIDDLGIKDIITTGPPQSLHLIGLYLKQNRPDINWIADFRDPWSFVFYNEVFQKTALSRAIDESLEQKVLKQADEVILVAPGMKRLYEELFNRDYKVITNGFDHSDFPDSAKAENEVFTIRYIGLLAESYDLGPLFDVLLRLKGKIKFRFEFIGQVHNKVHEYIKRTGLNDHVHIRDYVPHDEAIKEMQTADLLLFILPNAHNHPYILSGKLFEYIASTTPILHIGNNTGDAADVIEDLSAGKNFKANELEQILDYIIQLNQKRKHARNVQISKDHPYSRYSLTKQLTALFKG